MRAASLRLLSLSLTVTLRLLCPGAQVERCRERAGSGCAAAGRVGTGTREASFSQHATSHSATAATPSRRSARSECGCCRRAQGMGGAIAPRARRQRPAIATHRCCHGIKIKRRTRCVKSCRWLTTAASTAGKRHISAVAQCDSRLTRVLCSRVLSCCSLCRQWQRDQCCSQLWSQHNDGCARRRGVIRPSRSRCSRQRLSHCAGRVARCCGCETCSAAIGRGQGDQKPQCVSTRTVSAAAHPITAAVAHPRLLSAPAGR